MTEAERMNLFREENELYPEYQFCFGEYETCYDPSDCRFRWECEDMWKQEQEEIKDFEKVVEKNEVRKYMGPKYARVPRGAIVRLIAVVNGKMGIFEWNGERFNCPVRLLWRCIIDKDDREGE